MHEHGDTPRATYELHRQSICSEPSVISTFKYSTRHSRWKLWPAGHVVAAAASISSMQIGHETCCDMPCCKLLAYTSSSAHLWGRFVTSVVRTRGVMRGLLVMLRCTVLSLADLLGCFSYVYVQPSSGARVLHMGKHAADGGTLWLSVFASMAPQLVSPALLRFDGSDGSTVPRTRNGTGTFEKCRVGP